MQKRPRSKTSVRRHQLLIKKQHMEINVISVKENDYRIHSLYRSKDEAINMVRNSNFSFFILIFHDHCKNIQKFLFYK